MKLNLVSVLAGSAAVALLSGIATTAHAATDTTPAQYPWSVKLGAGFDTDGGGNNSAFGAGVSYDFGKSTATQPVFYQAYVDGYFKNGDSFIGLGPSLKFDLGSANTPNRPYVGVGLGLYILSGNGNNDTGFGGKVFGGYNFTQNVFAEVDYSIADVGGTAHILGTRLGYRF